MFLRKWNDLPEYMRTEEVRPYYDILKKKKLSLVIKRLFDVICSLIMLILLSPVMLLFAVWIKCDSKGPVFYRQERVTKYGKVFRIYKFRTMVTNADKIGTLVTLERDPRITKVGTKIRKLRIDEIPQLINVLKGEMSFVGTRPEVKKYVDKYTNEMYATLLLPAGITSNASIEFKDEDEILNGVEDVDKVYIEMVLPEKMKCNLDDIKLFGFIRELGTCFKTVIGVIK